MEINCLLNGKLTKLMILKLSHQLIGQNRPIWMAAIKYMIINSPDQNSAIQLLVFQAGRSVTTDLLVKIYKEKMLPEELKNKA